MHMHCVAVVALKPHMSHCAAANGIDNPGGAAMRRGATVSFSAVMPPRICAMSSRCSQVCGLFSAFVIKSATCCFVFTYSMRIRGCEHTSKSQFRSIRCVRGRCRNDIDLAFLTILMTASLSSAMIKLVTAVDFWVYAKYFPGSNFSL